MSYLVPGPDRMLAKEDATVRRSAGAILLKIINRTIEIEAIEQALIRIEALLRIFLRGLF